MQPRSERQTAARIRRQIDRRVIHLRLEARLQRQQRDAPVAVAQYLAHIRHDAGRLDDDGLNVLAQRRFDGALPRRIHVDERGQQAAHAAQVRAHHRACARVETAQRRAHFRQNRVTLAQAILGRAGFVQCRVTLRRDLLRFVEFDVQRIDLLQEIRALRFKGARSASIAARCVSNSACRCCCAAISALCAVTS